MRIFAGAVVLLALGLGMETAPLAAQDIPQDEYLNYMPLDYRRIVRQTDASAAFHLYGNRDDPDFRDENPRDGVDDARGRLFHELGVRFVLNMNRAGSKRDLAFPLPIKHFHVPVVHRHIQHSCSRYRADQVDLSVDTRFHADRNLCAGSTMGP